MMEEELSLLKKSLLALVVSSATTMTLSRLMRDYRNIVGGTFPVAKYGYKQPIEFLRERCTDIFVVSMLLLRCNINNCLVGFFVNKNLYNCNMQVEGPSWDPILTPKITKNLAHIDQMVQRQKVQSSAKQ